MTSLLVRFTLFSLSCTLHWWCTINPSLNNGNLVNKERNNSVQNYSLFSFTRKLAWGNHFFPLSLFQSVMMALYMSRRSKVSDLVFNWGIWSAMDLDVSGTVQLLDSRSLNSDLAECYTRRREILFDLWILTHLCLNVLWWCFFFFLKNSKHYLHSPSRPEAWSPQARCTLLPLRNLQYQSFIQETVE